MRRKEDNTMYDGMPAEKAGTPHTITVLGKQKGKSANVLAFIQ